MTNRNLIISSKNNKTGNKRTFKNNITEIKRTGGLNNRIRAFVIGCLNDRHVYVSPTLQDMGRITIDALNFATHVGEIRRLWTKLLKTNFGSLS